jgi:hypothetical protein
MTPLNFSVSNWQLTIGDDNWDITHLVSQFTLRRPRAEISTPYSWQGSLVLENPLNPALLAESLDDLENPQRWAIGIHAIKVRIEGRLITTLRIKKYFYDEDNLAGQAELTDQLGLRDFESPPKDFEGLGFQVNREIIPAATIVTKLLQMAGLTAVIGISGGFQVPPNKFSESYISLAQQICGERGYWLYCDENEIIRAVNYRPTTVLFQRSRPKIKVFERQSGLEIPSEIFRVSGACEKIATCGKDEPQITEEFASDEQGKILQRRETIFPSVTQGNQISRKFLIEQALGVALPDAYPGNKSVIETEHGTETNYFDGKARLTKSETITYKLLGVALPDNFPGNRASTKAEIVTIEYSNTLPGTARIGGDDGVLRGKTTTKKVLFPIGTSGYQLAAKEQIIESWIDDDSIVSINGIAEEIPKCERFEYKKIIYKRNSIETNLTIKDGSGEVESQSKYYSLGELLLKTTERQPNQNPPAWITKEPDNPIGSITIKGEGRFYPATFSPYYEKEFETSCSTLQNNAEAQELASLIGSLQHQRYRSRLITIPPSDIPEWLDDPTPFSTVNIHNGAFIMDSPAIVLERGTLTFSFIGNYLGAIPVIGDIPPTTPDLPTSPIRQTIKVTTNYDYLITVISDEVFPNFPSEIIASYDYGINLNVTAIINNYEYEITILSSNLNVSVQALYNYEIIFDIGIVNQQYNYEEKINYPMELSCYKG